MKRLPQISVMLALGLVVFSCGGNSSHSNGEASVYLTLEVETYNPDIDICLQTGDISIESITIASELVNAGGSSSSAQDVNLTRWVITPYRTDGGSTASPEWSYDQTVFVPSGGTAALSSYRVYPLEYLSESPLGLLLPENGGVDPETGNTNIRQSLQLQIFGQTISGKRVSTEPVPIGFNFFCNGQ